MNRVSSPFRTKARGFSLIEIIVTLIVAGILGTFLVTFVSHAVTRSGEPVIRSKQLYALQEIMENIKSGYMTMAHDTDALRKLQRLTTGADGADTSKSYDHYIIATKRIDFAQDGDDYVENTAACSGSDCALKVTVTSRITTGLSVTQIFTQRPQ